MGLEVKFRSGWENKFMVMLDNDPTVEGWWYEPFAIPYMSNKRTKTYRKYYPDFLVHYTNGKKALIEIKPSRKLLQKRNVKKILAAKDWCLKKECDFIVLTEHELKKIGVL